MKSKKNKNNLVIAYGLILAFILVMAGEFINGSTALISIGGLFFWIFGVWAIVYLFNVE